MRSIFIRGHSNPNDLLCGKRSFPCDHAAASCFVTDGYHLETESTLPHKLDHIDSWGDNFTSEATLRAYSTRDVITPHKSTKAHIGGTEY